MLVTVSKDILALLYSLGCRFIPVLDAIDEGISLLASSSLVFKSKIVPFAQIFAT